MIEKWRGKCAETKTGSICEFTITEDKISSDLITQDDSVTSTSASIS